MKPPSLTIGIEEEYQIIDPESRELRSYITEILDGDRMVLEQVKPELHQSIVEVGTNVCRSPAEARAELVRLRQSVISHVEKSGLSVAAAGTHVHIGIEDHEFLIDAMNAARYIMPHVLCLSTSSPFWMGRNKGLKSYRSVIFKNFPRTGIPPILRSATDYNELL